MLTGPATLLVNESALLTVAAHDEKGAAIPDLSPAQFASSDASIMTVASNGAVRAFRRGSATISVRMGNASAKLRMVVRANLVIRLAPMVDVALPCAGFATLVLGRTIRYAAVYLDVNGYQISEVPVAEWRSYRPDVATVAPDGTVTATGVGLATIVADGPDVSATAYVTVQPDDPGQFAIVQYANGIKSSVPVTFVSSLGDTITLAYGQSVDRRIPAGTFQVAANVFAEDASLRDHRSFCGTARAGDRLSVYAAGGASQGFIVPAWNDGVPVADTVARIRVLQGWSPFYQFYVRPTGAPATGIADECYFDPSTVSRFFSVDSTFDVILMTKAGSNGPAVRLPVFAPLGRTTTVILAGEATEDMAAAVFVDPP